MEGGQGSKSGANSNIHSIWDQITHAIYVIFSITVYRDIGPKGSLSTPVLGPKPKPRTRGLSEKGKHRQRGLR